jgi:hypothetical protein
VAYLSFCPRCHCLNIHNKPTSIYEVPTSYADHFGDRQVKDFPISFDVVLVPNLDKGANRGVGFELVTRFLAIGYSVYGTYRADTREDGSVQQVDSQFFLTVLHNLIL